MISKKVIFFILLCIAVVAIGVVLVLRQKEKLTLPPSVTPSVTPPVPLRYSVYYANWSQFWPGGPTDSSGVVNSPATMDLTNVDTIIYGVVMFGVMGNPLLQCYQSGLFCVTSNCAFYPSYSWGQTMLKDLENLPRELFGALATNPLKFLGEATVSIALSTTGLEEGADMIDAVAVEAQRAAKRTALSTIQYEDRNSTPLSQDALNLALVGTGVKAPNYSSIIIDAVSASGDGVFNAEMAESIANGTAAPPNPPVFIDSNTFLTFPMYPSYCFTGCENPRPEPTFGEELGSAFTAGLDTIGPCGKFYCCKNGRISDPDCFTQLKSVANGRKLIASYGGWTWTHGGAQFSDISKQMFVNMVSSRQTRAEFIAGSYSILSMWGFQGADFDWEYPGSTGAGGSASDFYNLACFFSEFHSAYPEFHLSMQCSGFLSSDARYASIPWPSGNIKLDTMQNTADYFAWINLMLNNGLTSVNFMAYDFYVAGGQDWVMPSTPLYSPTNPNPAIIGTDLSYNIFVPTPTTGTTESFTQNPPIMYSKSYHVVSGDTPDVIVAKLNAANYNCTYSDLLAANPKVNWSTLQIGNNLRLPGSGIASCGTYKVKSGDSAYSIGAANGGVSWQLIQLANQQIDWSNLQAGSLIYIPCVGNAYQPTPPPPAVFSTYTVVSGDTSTIIAQKLNCAQADLILANPQIIWNSLQIGAVLNIPGTGNPVCQIYTVTTGDSGYSISNMFKCTLAQLDAVNPLTNWNAITQGQMINIPCIVTPKGTYPGTETCPQYIVQAGQSYSSIESNYAYIENMYQPLGVTLPAIHLQPMNPTIPATQLQPGDLINVPPFAGRCSAPYYAVPGDTYDSIAAMFGVTTAQLKTVNSITSSSATSPTIDSTGLPTYPTQPQLIIPYNAVPEPVVIAPAPVKGLYPDFRTPGLNGAIEPTVGYSIVGALEAMKAEMGANISRVHLGLAFYGRSYANVNFMGLTGQALVDNIIGLPAGGAAPAGPYTSESGVLSYYEIFAGYSTTGYNAKYGVNVAYDIDKAQAVIYDGAEAIAAKMAIAKSYGLGGVMTFTPSQDNFGDFATRGYNPVGGNIFDNLFNPVGNIFDNLFNSSGTSNKIPTLAKVVQTNL